MASSSLKTFKRALNRRATQSTSKRIKLGALSSSINKPNSVEDSTDDNCLVSPSCEDNAADLDCDFNDECSLGREEGVHDDNLNFENNPGGAEDGVDSASNSSIDVAPTSSSEDEIDSNNGEGPLQFQNEGDKELFVIDTVREWAREPGVLSMSKLDALLHRLSLAFPRMPLTYTTLFQCEYMFDISLFPSGGTFWFKGIRANLDQLDLQLYLHKFKKIVLDIGMDGLPVVKIKLWPILGHLVGTENDPFIIGIYRGESDPSDVDVFLSKYVAELKDLLANGYTFEGTVYQFEIRNYILDAVARSFIKCCVRHNGFAGCEKCTVWGETSNNRTTFGDLDAPLRTDESFRQRLQPRHHRGTSPLEEVGTGMVSQFRLDPMHLVHGGVFKRLLEFWLYKVGVWKLHHEVVDLISSVFEFLRPYCPVDFNRKPRTLKYFSSLKVTECRRMLLYDGILAFKNLVDDNIYNHFLLLHCSMYIFSSKKLFAAKRDAAQEMIRTFVSHSAQIYGLQFIVYNVHSLIHLIEECDRGLVLDEFSAFKYENKLKSIKDTLRSGHHQLQQLARRDEEKRSNVVKLSSESSHVVVSLRNRNRPRFLAGQHFKKVKVGRLLLKVGKSDGCFKTKDGSIIVLRNIVVRKKKLYLEGFKFQQLEDYYDYPVPSSDLGIFRVSELLKETLVFRLRDVLCKCYLMPDGRHYFIVLRFHPTPSDDNQYFEVGLAQWLCGDLNDDMNGTTYWPPSTTVATPLIKSQAAHDPKWNKYEIEVMRYYDTFIRARAAVPMFINDSNYETESENLNSKKRRRILPQRFDSSSEDEIHIRRVGKPTIPAPPAILSGTGKLKGGQVPPAANMGTKAGRKELKKKERDELMLRLQSARAAAAAKMMGSPHKATSPWKVASSKTSVEPNPSDFIADLDLPHEENLNGDNDFSHFMDVSSFLNVDLEFEESPSTKNSKNKAKGTLKSNPILKRDVTPKKAPSPTPMKSPSADGNHSPSPTFKSYSALPRSFAFSLSPCSAQAVSASIVNTKPHPQKSPLRRGISNPATSTQECPIDDEDSGRLSGDPCDQIPNLGVKKSQVDGRRRLFPTEKKSTDERLEALEAGVLSLEVLARESSSKVDMVLMNLGRLQRCLLPNEKRIRRPPTMPKVPLESNNDLVKFEAFLKESDANLAAVVDYMACFMKTSVVDPERRSANNLLRNLMYNNLGKTMNLEGGNDKIGFRSLFLYKVFQGALQDAFPNSNVTIAEDALKKWLKDAKWRKQAPLKSPNKSPRNSPGPSRGRKGGGSRSGKRFTPCSAA